MFLFRIQYMLISFSMKSLVFKIIHTSLLYCSYKILPSICTSFGFVERVFESFWLRNIFIKSEFSVRPRYLGHRLLNIFRQNTEQLGNQIAHFTIWHNSIHFVHR